MNKNKIVELLERASEEHHSAFTDTKGVDENWSLWYAKWLMNDTLLSEEFDFHINESKLAYALLALDIEYTAKKPDEKWSRYYTENIEEYLKKETSN